MRVAFAILLVLSTPVWADMPDRGEQTGNIGVGVILGEPTGITAKLYLKDDQAIQGAVGAALIGGGFHLSADYVFHPFILQDKDSFVMPVYLGPGVRLLDYTQGRQDSYFAIGARGVAGLLFDFKKVPLDAFVEVAAVFEYGSSGHGGAVRLNAGAGVRYYF
jgi:hypothetical protein